MCRVFVENEESAESPRFVTSVEISFESELGQLMAGITDNGGFFTRESRVLHELSDSIY